MQTIPAVKTPTLMDLLQQLIYLWAEVSLIFFNSDWWRDTSCPITDIQYSII